ncbi:MAG TPA: hypothetical protein VHJ18_29040 [Streptosporangiaceae bacterium]|jgi:hypothetical protein|nr:hypothetical protein [Streptosporangiaceae bacterium]
MSSEHGEGTHTPDDFDRQLRDLYSGSAGAARFREPSAAERAKRAARRRRQTSGQSRRQPMSWGKARRARKLLKPVTSGDAKPTTRGRSWRRLVPFGRGRPAPRRPLSPGERRRRLRSVAKGTGILIGFVALLLLMHMLGLGPQ